MANITCELEYNNVFSIEDSFLKNVLKDCCILSPPDDFDPNKFDEENNVAKKQQEEKKNLEVDSALRLITEIHHMANTKDFKSETRSITRFKKEIQSSLKDSEVEIYIKVVTNTPTDDAIEKDKNSKNPIVVSTSSKQEIRVYLHPVKNDP